MFTNLYTRKICIGCAEFYKAWAYYYEVIGEFQNADAVYQRGVSNFAQPHEELQIARQNLLRQQV